MKELLVIFYSFGKVVDGVDFGVVVPFFDGLVEDVPLEQDGALLGWVRRVGPLHPVVLGVVVVEVAQSGPDNRILDSYLKRKKER